MPMTRAVGLVACVLATTATSAVAAADQPTDRKAPDTNPAFETVPAGVKAELRTLLEYAAAQAQAQTKAGRTAEARASLTSAVTRAAGKLDAEGDAAASLRRAVEDVAGQADDAEAVNRLQGGAREAVTALGFTPLVEAPLAAGFPGPGPVGKVVVKAYPAYRMARTAMTAGDENKPFWTLFRHIESNGIKMTAPVEMGYRRGAGAAVEPRSMAFLYGAPTAGTAGPRGDVTVVDVPAMTVVSVGVRGSYADARVRDELAKIDRWLAGQQGYERAGEPRLLGYNSPMVLPWLRYAEVQVPVRARGK